MTPFGALLRYYRQERGLTQQEMARQLSVDSKHISSLETGRRRPPELDELEKVFSALQLTQSQRDKLRTAAQDSAYLIRIPREVSPLGLQLAHHLVRSLRGMRPEQITAIQALIEETANMT